MQSATHPPLALLDVSVDSEFDVIVVGGESAGLICTRELVHQNLRVLIIDARDRLGGRALTAEYEK